jgi:hemolysin III
MQEQAPYTREQEIASSLSHGIGIILSIVGIPVLMALAVKNGYNTPTLIALALYCASLLAVFVSSTLYHAIPDLGIKRIFKMIDHICIYFLIAGTITAFVTRFVDSATATKFLLLLWTLVAAGIIYKFYYLGKNKLLSTLIYAALIATVVFVIRPILTQIPFSASVLIFSGIASYGVGTFFYMSKNIYYQHAIWHVFVLGGSACHYVSLVQCCS